MWQSCEGLGSMGRLPEGPGLSGGTVRGSEAPWQGCVSLGVHGKAAWGPGAQRRDSAGV